MASTNFLVHDTSMTNMESDSAFQNDSQRLNGVTAGMASSAHFNKVLHQSSIMTTAMANAIVAAGYNANDTDLASLTQGLQNTFPTNEAVQNSGALGNIAYRGLTGQYDLGQINFLPQQTTPTAPTVTGSGTGILSGAYKYVVVFITGYQNADGAYNVSGFAPGAESTAVTLTGQSGYLSAIPTGAAGTIGRAIYRTVAGGTAGAEKFCGIIWDNSTSVYTDNLPDASLGTGIPSNTSGNTIPTNVPVNNTTGTTFVLPTIYYPTLLNGWQNFGNGWQPICYSKDCFNRMWLRGVINGGSVGTSTPVLVIPQGFRIPYEMAFYSDSIGAYIDTVINPNGNVTCYASNERVSINIMYQLLQ